MKGSYPLLVLSGVKYDLTREAQGVFCECWSPIPPSIPLAITLFEFEAAGHPPRDFVDLWPDNRGATAGPDAAGEDEQDGGTIATGDTNNGGEERYGMAYGQNPSLRLGCFGYCTCLKHSQIRTTFPRVYSLISFSGKNNNNSMKQHS